MAIETRIISQLDELKKFSKDIDKLAMASDGKHPFLTYRWTESWWLTFGTRKKRFKTKRLFVICVFENRELIGLAPFVLVEYRLSYFKLFSFLKPIGSDQNLTEIKPLFAPIGREQEVIEHVNQVLTQNQCEWDLCQWPDIACHSESAGSGIEHVVTESFIITLGSDWELFRTNLKRNIKESIRKCMNAPVRAGIELEFKALTDPQNIISELPAFFNLHGMRAKYESSTLHPDYFSKPLHQDFIKRVILGDDSFQPCLFLVYHESHPIAARLGFIQNDSLFMYYSGFDPKYAPYSVPTRLLVEAMKFAMSKGVTALNLSTGRDESKLRWGPEVKAYYRFISINKGIFSRSAYFMFSKLRALAHRRNNAALYSQNT